MPPVSALALLILLSPAADAGVCEDLAQQVDRDRLQADLGSLTGEAAIDGDEGPVHLASRHVDHPDHALAQAWLTRAFEARGLPTELDPFELGGRESLANVVADLPGEAPPVCVTAHFDSTGQAEDGWDPSIDPAPGADDDASGVAAVLEAARILGGWEPGFGRALRFVAFDAEEQGLHGSWHHALALDEDGVEVVLNLDPVGFNAGGVGNLWLTFDPRWEDEALAAQEAGERLGTPLSVATINADLLGGDARSDHYPFWAEGWPALHIASFPQPPEYHTPSDLPDLVDLDFLRAVTQLVVARACEAAEPEDPPLQEDEDDAQGVACAGCTGQIGGPSAGVLLALLVAGRRRRGEWARCVP